MLFCLIIIISSIIVTISTPTIHILPTSEHAVTSVSGLLMHSVCETIINLDGCGKLTYR